MKKQGPGKQGNEGSERMERLLRRAMPPIGVHAGPSEDLWPAMTRRMRAEAAPQPTWVRVPWFDWALGAGLALLLAAFPAWIPVLLYYL